MRLSLFKVSFLVINSLLFPYYKAEKLSLREYSFSENEAEQLKDINMKEKNIEEYWKKAKEILHRIEQLEAEENKVGFFVSKNTELFSNIF